MPDQHFIIPDTLTTKSIKVDLYSKDRLKWKTLTPWMIYIVHRIRAWALLLRNMTSETRTITTANTINTMIKIIHQAIPTRHKPSMIQDKYS